MMARNEQNPVVLLTRDSWHIVEDSRHSTVGLCGQPVFDRRAHFRLSRVGEENVCPDCMALWRKSTGKDS